MNITEKNRYGKNLRAAYIDKICGFLFWNRAFAGNKVNGTENAKKDIVWLYADKKNKAVVFEMNENDIREACEYLDEVIAEYRKLVKNIGKNGLSASLLMNYRDEIQDILMELTPEDIDLRQYRKDIILLDNELRQKAQIYVNEVGHENFKQYQIINDPPRERWWWYLNKVTSPPLSVKKPWEFWKK